MGQRDAVFIHDEVLDQGGYPSQCPFNTGRPGRTRRLVEQMGLLEGTDRRLASPVPLEPVELERFHEPDYLAALRESSLPGAPEWPEFGLGTMDCPVFEGMYDYVRLAAGGTLTGARMLLTGEAGVVFSPAGGFHHALPGRASGFCYINDVVIAIRELTAAGKRVCFLDIDVHHCDGVQQAFFDCPDVMVLSLHESGETLFPGTGWVEEAGSGAGLGHTVNIPLPVGTYDEAYERVFRDAAWPLLTAFDPDVIVLELGMDTLAGDPLAHLHLTNNVPADITARVVRTGKPVLAVGGGGYHVANTVRAWALCWSVLCGEDLTHDGSLGMGGVMLGNTNWAGGLKDRILLSDAGVRLRVDESLRDVQAQIRRIHFPRWGLV